MDSSMDSQSFGSIIDNIRINNREAMNEEYEEMPELALNRTFPRNINRDEDPAWFSQRYKEYHDGETPFIPQIPDPWKVSEGLPSQFLADRNDFYESLDLAIQWTQFLKIPATTLIMIRSLLNMILDTIEVEGFLAPIGITRLFSDYIVKNFPEDIPRIGNPPMPDIEDECVEMSDLFEIYSKQFGSGLKSRQNFINYNKWAGRRTNYNNWSKFASLMKDLASDLGPFSHNLLNEVNENIDSMLAHQHLNTDEKVITINDHTTSARKWALSMFNIPAVIKIQKGKPVVIKRGIPAPVDYVLNAVLPKIIAREQAEQLVADADNVPNPLVQDEEFTISEHELDSGIL